MSELIFYQLQKYKVFFNFNVKKKVHKIICLADKSSLGII